MYSICRYIHTDYGAVPSVRDDWFKLLAPSTRQPRHLHMQVYINVWSRSPPYLCFATSFAISTFFLRSPFANRARVKMGDLLTQLQDAVDQVRSPPEMGQTHGGPWAPNET